jgi:biopolymer transport protein ExbD
LKPVTVKVDPPPGPARKPVMLKVENDGRLYIGQAPTTREALAQDLGKAVGGEHPTDEQVLIAAGNGVDYKDFMAVLDILQAAGFSKIVLIAEDA